MSRFWRVFLVWFLAISGVWVIANLPCTIGKGIMWLAGFPWVFAFWDFGKLKAFDSMALAADFGLGLGLALTTGLLCAWSRCHSHVP